jgi:hypothetical protein
MNQVETSADSRSYRQGDIGAADVSLPYVDFSQWFHVN